jgi:NAD(P)-dependent dehydrogenase (short-subunit alcohol dehydrogenase family)
LARNQGALEEVDDEIKALGGQSSLILLDLADGPAIDALGPALYERFGRLDILVGNAGVLGRLSPLTHIPSEIWDKVLTVNLTANWRLIRTLDPLLRRSEAGRAIFVTSGASRGPAYWGPYAVSKAALETLAMTYANETLETDIRVNLINPGAMATRMRAEAYPGENPDTLPQPEAVSDIFVELALPTTQATAQIFTRESQ